MPQQVAVVERPILHWTHNKASYNYTLTPTDYLWWVRAIWREGKPQIAVGHTLLQRFAYLYSTGKKYPTLASFLRAYCQPINPLWLPGGRLSDAKIARLVRTGNKTGADAERQRAKQRAIYSQTPLSKIPAKYRNIADAILAGVTASPTPVAMHFTTSFALPDDTEEEAANKARAYATKRKLEIVPIPEGFKPGLNWFFATPGKRPPRVTIAKVSTVASMTASIMPGLLIGLAVLFVFTKKKRIDR